MDMAKLKQQFDTRTQALAAAIKEFHARSLRIRIVENPKRAAAQRREYAKLCEDIERLAQKEIAFPKDLLNWPEERAKIVKSNKEAKIKFWQFLNRHEADYDDIFATDHEFCGKVDASLTQLDKAINQRYDNARLLLETMGELTLAYYEGDLVAIDRLSAKLNEFRKK